MRIGGIALDISPLRASRDFRFLLAGRSVAMGGQAMAVAAANWQVYELTRSSLYVGLLSLATSAGMLSGLLAGGMLADRHDRRSLMLASRLPLAALALLLMINSLLPRPALGALIGAATSGWTGRVRRPGLVVVGAGVVWGAAIVGFGLSDDLPLALAFLALAGMGDLVSEVLRNALLQHYTPDPLRGRVSSLYLAQVTTAPALGNAEAGTVAQLFTTTISVVSGGLACVAGALLLSALIPALRHATLADPAEPGDPGEALAQA